MAKFEKGRAKTGGRKPGVQNKSTSLVKQCLAKITSDYIDSGKLQEDLADLKPKDRLEMIEKLLQYTTPKMQSVAVSSDEEHPITIEEKLLDLSQI